MEFQGLGPEAVGCAWFRAFRARLKVKGFKCEVLVIAGLVFRS